MQILAILQNVVSQAVVVWRMMKVEKWKRRDGKLKLKDARTASKPFTGWVSEWG